MNRRHRRHLSGAAAVEFAIVLPFLLLILFAILEGAWMAATQMALNHAASTGAKAAIKAREWEDEDPGAFGRAGAQNAFWMGQLSDEEVEVRILERTETLPRRAQVRIEQLQYKPLTGLLPRSMLPERLKALAAMPFM